MFLLKREMDFVDSHGRLHSEGWVGSRMERRWKSGRRGGRGNWVGMVNKIVLKVQKKRKENQNF